ncbi:ABC transporter ATP-binding protein [Myxococcota bacterium]|nr:ABC transporter ATP-binding protein [Myxococcota bacterium]
MSAEIAVHIEGMGHSYGSLEVIRRLDVEIAKGEFVAIVGPSGCGKTTLLNLLSGYLTPTKGKVHRSGTVRTIYQTDGLFPWLSVAGNIGLGLRHEPEAERDAIVKEWLEHIRLEEFANHYPHQLSGGMRQRVELARILAGRADVLLMDEPFSALDYQTRLNMRGELARVLAKAKRTVVFVTHDIPEAAQLADRVLVLSGRPSRLVREIRMTSPRPRDLTFPDVAKAVEDIHTDFGIGHKTVRQSITAERGELR